MNSDHPSYERYQRQLILKAFGEAGQHKLSKSKVLVVGAGGLGCAALQYLAAAGIGNIGIVDDDVVSLTNLHRQVLYATADIGYSKATKAKYYLDRLNPDINIIAFNERLTTKNALAIIKPYDIVIDGTDNFASRYLINDACVLLNKPLVYGAVSQFEGQVAIFNCSNELQDPMVNYRDLFPGPPKNGDVLSCAEAGVLGVLPGIIGTMQASETIKLITGIGKPLINSLLTYNALNNRVYEVTLTGSGSAQSLIPVSLKGFEEMDYEWFCGIASQQFEIDVDSFDRLREITPVDIIDVRDADERPLPAGFNYIRIPLSGMKENTAMFNTNTVILFCQSGKRSLEAAQWLFDKFDGSKKIYSLQGGILNWLKYTKTSLP